MPKYTERLAIGMYEFIEIQADRLSELTKAREEYLASDYIMNKTSEQTDTSQNNSQAPLNF